MLHSIKASLKDTYELLRDLMNDPVCLGKIETVSQLLSDTFQQGGKVIIFGNGGSACDAMHFAEEFTGRYRDDRKPLPAIALTDSAHITCVGNDYGFDEIFSRGIEAYARPGDLVIGISTSGNSSNILKAIHKAKELNCHTFGLLGKDGGKMKCLCEHEIIVRGQTSDRIQEIHMMVLHIIIECVERTMFPNLYSNE